MDFSRQKLEHLKWIRRKELIKINCAIIMGLFIAIFLLMGFPIISNASQISMNDYDSDWKQKLISSDGYSAVNPNADTETCASSYLSSGYNSLLSFDDLIINWNDNFYSDYSIDDFQIVYMEIKNDNEVNLHCFIPDLNSYPNMKLSLIGCKNGSFRPYVINSEGAYNWSGGRPAYFVDCKYSLNTSTGQFDWVSRTWNSTYADYDNYNYGYMNSLTNGYAICYANCPIKSIKYVQNDHSNNVADIYFNHDFIDINYKLNFSSVPSNSSDIQDHLTLYDNSVCYLVPSTMDNGDFYIYANFDDEQKKFPDNYRVIIDVTAYYSFNYNNGASYVSITNNGQPLKNLFSLDNNAVNSFSDNTRFSIGVSEFSNGKYTLSLHDINTALKLSNDYSISEIAQALSNTTSDANAFTTVVQAISGLSIMGNKVDLSNALLQGYDCVPSAISYNFDIYVARRSNNDNTAKLADEASLAYTYDFITGNGNLNYSNLADDQKVKDSTDSQTIPPAYNHDVNKPTYDNTLPSSNNNDNSSSSNSNSSDNITVSGGDNSINNIVNVNQGNKYPDKGVMQSFVRIINNDKNNTVNDIDTLIGGSSYIQLMNNALVAVPDQVWSIWITALKAILGIAVSAFFLKILINWAT